MFSTISRLKSGLSDRPMGAELKAAGEGEARVPTGLKLGGVAATCCDVPGDDRLGVVEVVAAWLEDDDVDGVLACCHLLVECGSDWRLLCGCRFTASGMSMLETCEWCPWAGSGSY